jgi:hypothetical protein
MLTDVSTNFETGESTVRKLSEEEEQRLQNEAREDRIRQQLDHDYWYNTEIKKRDAAIAEKDPALSKEKADLVDKMATLAKANKAIASQHEERVTKKIAALDKNV